MGTAPQNMGTAPHKLGTTPLSRPPVTLRLRGSRPGDPRFLLFVLFSTHILEVYTISLFSEYTAAAINTRTRLIYYVHTSYENTRTSWAGCQTNIPCSSHKIRTTGSSMLLKTLLESANQRAYAQPRVFATVPAFRNSFKMGSAAHNSPAQTS